MALAPGSELGPYEILAPLGAGGMGEVYRARDTRLGRGVAIKVLPDHLSHDPKALARFETEARAVATLSHPNILFLLDVGEANGIHFAVTELLEGEALRALVARGAIPVKRTLEIAHKVAEGLAAAHEKGIVHRDLKPENIFLTKDGHAKILDFGLARHEATFRDPNDTHSPTVSALTEAGAVLGTVAYMSPEQASGKPVDHRSDQFSHGVVLYEMLAGKRPFKGATAAETLTAIIREEPEPLEKLAPRTPAPVRWLVERCLAKDPTERYDSTRDLARDLSSCRNHLAESTSGAVEAASAAPVVRRRRTIVLLGVVAVSLVGLGFAGAFALLRGSKERPAPRFQRLTFKRGTVSGARFAPDGRTVVYSAEWDGGPPAVYSLRLDALNPVPSGYPGANLLAVSAKGQLALSLPSGMSPAMVPIGTLALAPFAGGTPRELDPDVAFADFSRDGEMLATTRGRFKSMRLEYPSGTVLYRSPGSYLSHVRISPSGELVAFLEHLTHGYQTGDVVVVDRSGKLVLRKGPFGDLHGLAWSPRGDEVWFGGGITEDHGDLRAVTLGGHERVLLAAPVSMILHDVAPDGRVLASTAENRFRVFCRGEAASPERELSAQDGSVLRAISPDGSWVAFSDDPLGAPQCYLRSTSGAPPVELGPGIPVSFAPDGRTLVVIQFERNIPAIVLHPVGPGQPTTIPIDGFEVGDPSSLAAGLFPDGKAIWFRANQPSRPPRTWEVAVTGEVPRPLTPEGVSAWVTADGLSLVFSREDKLWIQPILGGEARQVEGPLEDERVAAWTPDGRPVFIFSRYGECPVKVYRLDPKTGRREFFREVGPADATGVQSVNVLMTPDGRVCAYNVWQWLTELHLIEGLR